MCSKGLRNFVFKQAKSISCVSFAGWGRVIKRTYFKNQYTFSKAMNQTAERQRVISWYYFLLEVCWNLLSAIIGSYLKAQKAFFTIKPIHSKLRTPGFHGNRDPLLFERDFFMACFGPNDSLFSSFSLVYRTPTLTETTPSKFAFMVLIVALKRYQSIASFPWRQAWMF